MNHSSAEEPNFDLESWMQRVFPVRMELLPEALNDAMVPMFPHEVEDDQIILILELSAVFRVVTGWPEKFGLAREIVSLVTIEQAQDPGPLLTRSDLRDIRFLAEPRWSEFSLHELSRELAYPLCEPLEEHSDASYWANFDTFRQQAKRSLAAALPNPQDVLEQFRTRLNFDYEAWLAEWQAFARDQPGG